MPVRVSKARSILVGVDDKKMAGREQKMAPMSMKFMKNVHVDEPTSFLAPCLFGMYST